MDVVVERLTRPGAADAPLEVVERKGARDPDTLCDRAAEETCRALCRLYEARVGAIVGRLPELTREILDGRHPLF